MKLHKDLGPLTWELDGRDLANVDALERVARRMEPGEMVYAPPSEASAASTTEPRVASVPRQSPIEEDDEPRGRMHTERLDDARRLELLRAVLRKHGRELEPRGAFYAEVIER